MTAPAAPVLVITGTDTEIGKTVTTAAVAAALRSQGQRVHVVKPTQTGLAPGEPGDVAEVARLAGPVDTHEFVRLPDPLAPDVASRVAGQPIPAVGAHAERIAQLARSGAADVVLVEGAGGLLVRLDTGGGTLADLAIALRDGGIRVGTIVVARDDLGTLNHTELTLEALRARDLDLVGVVVGSAHAEPDLAQRTNLDELAALTGGRLLGVIPAGSAALDPQRFRDLAPSWVRL